MNTYKVPDKYYIRIHHVRPRFKNDIENLLLYMAGEISKLAPLPKKVFDETLNAAIYKYPGNITKTLKTINNWRTEISSLFGFIINDGQVSKPGKRAAELYESEDLIETFKKFLYTFQYPGAHIKAHENKILIEQGVNFKPAKFILSLLKKAEELEGKRVGIIKAELCHCVLNDLRCVRDNENPRETWERISQNRKDEIKYDMTSDVIRYAGDILDYMEIANLLITYDGRSYYINTLENEMISKYISSNEWFNGYDYLIANRAATLDEINQCNLPWAEYVNQDLGRTDFSTDILTFIAQDSEDYEQLKQKSVETFEKKLDAETSISTKDIGDMGEGMVYSHECQRMKLCGRNDLIHLIQRIPTKFAVGYDIQSVEVDERKRYIEVKTTISMKPLHFAKIHLTSNEWSAAKTTKDRYFIYRLAISKQDKKLFIIQDPVGLYKSDLIDMIPRGGAEITFDTKNSGHFEEMLSWTN